jgi:universal stress protein E
MFGVRRVLVGVDWVESTSGDRDDALPLPTREAIRMAERIAAFSRAALTYMHVDEEGVSPGPADGPPPAAGSRTVLEGLVSDATARGIEASLRVVPGRSWQELVRDVLRHKHQLVVVGTREQSATRRRLLGSTAMRLLRSCPSPVWVTRPLVSEGVPTVLVADDLSDVGGQCLELGVSAARMLQGRLLVLHAVQFPLLAHLRRTGVSEGEIAQYCEKVREEATQAVHNRLARTDYRTIEHGSRVLISTGRPDIMILEAAEEHRVDLLVMGTIARGGVAGLLLGNTAERLLPEVSCSVLAVKPDDFACPVTLD